MFMALLTGRALLEAKQCPSKSQSRTHQVVGSWEPPAPEMSGRSRSSSPSRAPMGRSGTTSRPPRSPARFAQQVAIQVPGQVCVTHMQHLSQPVENAPYRSKQEWS